MRTVLVSTVTISAPDETAEYAQHIFDQCVDFMQEHVTKWNEENKNGVKFELAISLGRSK